MDATLLSDDSCTSASLAACVFLRSCSRLSVSALTSRSSPLRRSSRLRRADSSSSRRDLSPLLPLDHGLVILSSSSSRVAAAASERLHRPPCDDPPLRSSFGQLRSKSSSKNARGRARVLALRARRLDLGRVPRLLSGSRAKVLLQCSEAFLAFRSPPCSGLPASRSRRNSSLMVSRRVSEEAASTSTLRVSLARDAPGELFYVLVAEAELFVE